MQDRGRLGYEHLGVMVNGALDTRAAAWANRQAGNRDGAAVLEMTLLAPTLEVLGDGANDAPRAAALAGADLSCTFNGQPWLPGEVHLLHPGDRIGGGSARRGVRAYLAVTGGVDVPMVMGSRATDLLAGIGGLEGRALRVGDSLALAAPAAEPADAEYARFEVPSTLLEREVVRALTGHRAEGAASSGLRRLVETWYRVDHRSDRVGLRLRGPRVPAAVRGDEISEGMAIGAVEITSSGEPLLLLRSRGSIGGYPTLAVVISADLPALAQRKPGDRLRLRLVEEREALEAWRAQRSVTLRSPRWAVWHGVLAPGTRVERGDAIAELEVMGEHRTLRTPIGGRLVRMLAENGADVHEAAPVCEILADE
ncbi:urea amidolyase [bacterium]|nr:MAG: urea amidolyase [bacterium]